MDDYVDTDHDEILFESSAPCAHDSLTTYSPDRAFHNKESDDDNYNDSDDDVLQEDYDSQSILFEGDHLVQPVEHHEQNRSATEGGTIVPNR